MQRITVSSSNLASVGYDSQNSILEIEFNNGSIYQYFNVPERIYNELMNASSHGQYFYAYVRQGGYRYTRVR